jgi:DNA-binding XRE family transcriptional regulator
MKKTIKQIIVERGLTLKVAAEACGLPVHTVVSHYYGRRSGMTLGTARKYAAGLGVSVEEIMEGRA